MARELPSSDSFLVERTSLAKQEDRLELYSSFEIVSKKDIVQIIKILFNR